MISFLASLDAWGFPAMRYLLSALWQSSLLFTATFALAYFLRRRRAAVRHALWALALLMAPTLPLLTSGFERAGAPQMRLTMLPAYQKDEVGRMKDEAGRMKDEGGRMKDESRRDTSGALSQGVQTGLETMPPVGMRTILDYPWALGLIFYTAGLALFLVWIALGRLRIRQWIGAAMPVTDERALAAFHVAREALRFRRACLVLQSPRVPVPISVGILKSRVLLPSALPPRLSDEELRAVALHETAHLSRRDPLVLTLAALARAALFFHPLVWFAARQVSVLAEHCADDAVLDATGRPLPYAELLARLAEELPAHPFAAEMATGILLTRGAFLRRVEAILGDRDRARCLTRRALAATAAAVLLSIAVALAVPLGEKGSNTKKSELYENARASSKDLKVKAGPNAFAVTIVERNDRNGHICYEDGKGLKVGAIAMPVAPNMEKQAAWLDMANVHFQVVGGGEQSRLLYDIIEMRVFDHETRQLLKAEGERTGVFWDASDYLLAQMYSMGKPLPNKVDVWFRAASYPNANDRVLLEPKSGRSFGFAEGTLTIREIKEGQWGFSSSNGQIQWKHEPRVKTGFTLLLDFTGKWTEGRYQIRAMHQQGAGNSPSSLDYVDFSKNAGPQVVYFDMPLQGVSWIELRPFGGRHTFYFDSVQLPKISPTPLALPPAVTFQINGKEVEQDSEALEPIGARIITINGMASGFNSQFPISGLTRERYLSEYGPAKKPNEYASILLVFPGIYLSEIAVGLLDRNGQPFPAGSIHMSEETEGGGSEGAFVSRGQDIPLEKIGSVEVFLGGDKGDSSRPRVRVPGNEVSRTGAVAAVIPLGERASGSIRALAEGDIQERGKAAELLVREVKEGKMDRDQAMRISQVLIPRLQRMADREETQGGSSLDISHGELQLAWELLTREHVPRKQSVTMFSLLDTPWCQYIPRDPARFELHGNLKAPPRGIIVQRLIWTKAVDGPTTKQRILESFIAARGDGITWGEESLADLHPLTSQSLSIEMETTLYNAPPAVVERLPYRATKPAEFDEFKAAVSDESCKKLLEYTLSAELSEENKWRHWFQSDRAESKADFTAAPKASDPPTTVTADVQREIGSLRSSDRNLRGRGAFLLGEMKGKAAPAIPMLVSLLGDDKQSDFEANGNMHNSHVYDEAATSLGKIGIQAIKPLIAKLAEVGSASDKAADALAHIGEPAVAALTTALKDDNNRVRAKAAGVLARTGGISLENLLQALNDKDQDQETRAAVAEGLRWTEDARATKALIDLLNDENSKVRACAASALGRAGNKAAVGPLIGRLNDKDMQVRVNATFALGKIGDKGAVASLLAITRGESEGYRDGAFQALRMIGDPGSAEAVAKLLEASDPGTRLESLRTLGDFNHPLAFETPQSAKPVADLLLNKKEDWEVRLAAANTLRLYRDPYAMDALETVLKDSTESEDLRSRAAKSLGRLGTPGIERLMNLEQSNDVELKRLATTGLKEILVTSSYPDARYTLWWEVYMDALREVVGALATPAELDAVAKGPELPLAAAEKHPNPHIRSVAPLAEKIAEEEWDLHPLLRRLGKPNYPDSYPWGEAVNRVQCRLRMRQLDFWEWNRFGGETLWTGDDAPQIKMDIRNQGTLDLNCSVPPSQLRLEVDGVEYGRPRTETPGPQIPLWPGQQRNAFRVVLDKKWLRVERPLQMEAGKHTVRVVVQLNPTAGENFAVYSNPIEVKVFPSKKERYELQNFRIEAGFVPDRNEIQAGEELGVESYVRNVGDAAFGLRVGGDGRGVRPTRFKISAVDADGNKVTDPNANAMNMGGFGGCPMIEPGKSYAESLFLSKWCEFVKPGVYTVTCTSILRISKDGTSDFDERKMLQLPIETRFTLTVKEPTAQDAREKVESMLKNRDKADFSILRSPVYLPVLREYAAKEDGDAVKGIGSIQTPEATKALIALAEDWLKQGKTALAFQAIRPLRSRLPNPGWYPADQSKASGDGYFAPDRERVERTWRAEFALPMRGMARRLVRNTDQESLETGGYILQCVGTAEDLPDLMIGYTNAIEATKTLPFETHQYFRPRGASYRYRFAARQLIERGGAVPEKPNTPGEAATYLIAMQAKKDFRPADWPQRVLRWLDYATPYMREFVLDFMPDPIPDAALDKIPALLADPYVDLQIAACHTAQKHPRETFREPLLAILDKGTEQYLLNAAAAAAPANGIPTDRTMEIWVRRMDRNDLGTKAVIRLLLAILDNNQRGDPQELSAEATAAAQARWKRFIEENREKLRQGKRFKIGDPEITPDLFPPGFTWYKDDKAWPPQNDPSSAAVTGTKRSSDAEGVADFTAAPKASDPPTTATADVQSEPERLVARSAPGVAGEERKKLGKGESAESIRFPSQPDKAVPGSSETAEQKIQRSIARWDFTRAIPAAGDLLKRAPDDPARGRCHLLQARAYGVWGVEYRDAVARDKGRRHLEQAFALNPGLKNELDVARLRAFFFAYRQSSKSAVNQALADAQKEIKSHPRDAQAHYYLGMLHHVLATNSDFAYTKPEQDEERRLALESMAKAVELDPKRYEYWSYYVSAFAYAGQKEEAKKAADRMMKEADLSQEKIPPSATCAYEIMSALMAPEEGYAYLRAQAARDPSYAPLQFVAAERYDEKDPVRYRMLTDLAARIASGDLRLPPWQARLELQTLYKSGSLHYQAGEFEKALEDYDRIISLSPYYAQVRLNRGSVHRVLAEKAATPEEKARLLEKAKNDFEAGLQYPWHDQVAGAKEELDKTVKDLEPLRAVLPAGPSKNAQESRTEDAEWGEAVDGVQVRLRVEKAIWNAGEILTFKVDLLNQGTRRLSFDPLAKELDLSGHWYRRLQPKRPVEGRPLGPRTDYSDISVDFDSKQWADGTAPHASPPAPGKYTVRVAFQFRVEDGGSSVRAVSNPVEIEVGVPGEAFLLGTVSFRILSPSSDDSRVPENTYRLPPGEYQVFQEYRFARIDGEATDGTDKSTFRSGALPLTVVKALPVQSP